MARDRGRRVAQVLLVVAALIGTVVVAAHFALDPIAARVTRRQLAKLDGMRGSFSKVHVSVLPAAYDIYDLKIEEQPLSRGREPLLYAQRIEARWKWLSLLHRRREGRVKIWNAKIVVDATPRETPKDVLLRKAKRKLPPPKGTAERLERMPPFRLTRLEVVNSQALVIDHRHPELPRVWLHDAQVTVENLASRRALTAGKPVVVTGRAVLQHSGDFDLFLTADPLDRGLTFAGEAQLRNLQLADLYEFVKAKTGLQIPQGSFSVYAAFTCKRGTLDGGVEPVLKGVTAKPAKAGLENKLKAALANVAVKVASDRVPGRNAVVGVVPIHGDLRRPNAEIMPAILSVVRNAFVEGLTASLTNVPPPEAPKKEGVVRQARRALSKGRQPGVRTQPQQRRPK